MILKVQISFVPHFLFWGGVFKSRLSFWPHFCFWVVFVGFQLSFYRVLLQWRDFEYMLKDPSCSRVGLLLILVGVCGYSCDVVYVDNRCITLLVRCDCMLKYWTCVNDVIAVWLLLHYKLLIYKVMSTGSEFHCLSNMSSWAGVLLNIPRYNIRIWLRCEWYSLLI